MTKEMDGFIELVFEADLDTSEHPEHFELASELVNEYADTRVAAIQELRDMIYERGECSPRRTDDEYLLRFLRARRFVVPRAYKQLVRYCKFLEQYPQLYKGVDLFELAKAGNVYIGCLLDRPGIGRVSVIRFGLWNPDDYPAEELVKTALAVLEVALRVPRLQVLGGTIIVDLEGLTIKHVASFTPTIAFQIVCLLGLAIPSRMQSCHIINYNWLLNTFFFVFKRFISKRAWKRIYFHGHDMESLHQHIDPAILPPEYGGTCRLVTPVDNWLCKLKKYRDETFDKEMREYGWLIKE